jgi:small subunit ribosomal protein S1
MAALLEAETAEYPELRRGEIIEGTVVGNDRDGILVDIGAKSEGVVPPQEMHCLQPEGSSQLSEGDKVLVFILQPESPEGQIILSLDRARGERGWRVLQDYMDQNEAFEAFVTGSNKGGLLVNVEGVNAFVPLSQIVGGPERGNPEQTQKSLGEWVGKGITLKVIELNRRRNRAILSERAAVQERRAAEKERLLKELVEGDVRTGRITSIRDFGVFVDVGGADGLVHLSELSWERTPKTPNDLFKVGEEVPVFILKVDQESKKIALSIRRAQPERWVEIVSRYREGQIVPGQVTKLAPFGAFVRLEGPIEGLIHISELVDRRINHPKEVVDEDEVVPVKIVRIEHDRHRLGLSLRQARDKSEGDGWEFSDTGGVLKAPQEALDALGVTSQPVRTVDTSGETAEASEGEGAAPEAVAGEPASDASQAPETAADAPDAEATVPAEASAEAAVAEVSTEIDEPVAEVASETEAEETGQETAAPEDVSTATEEVEVPVAAGSGEAAVEVAEAAVETEAAEPEVEEAAAEAAEVAPDSVESEEAPAEAEEAAEPVAETASVEEPEAVAEDAAATSEETSDEQVAAAEPASDRDESGETEEKTPETDAEAVTDTDDEALNKTEQN